MIHPEGRSSLSVLESEGSAEGPYVGPRPFDEGERLYGRDRQVEELFDILLTERIVLLHSPSGAGKTSLIQSALIPRLRERLGRVAVYGPTRVGATDRPGSINRYISSAIWGWEKERSRVGEHPSAGSMTLSDYLTEREKDLPDGTPEVLIFDQFEEILTIDPGDTAGKAEFFRQLGAALRPRHRWALFAMREEYVARLDPYLHMIPTRVAERYPLGLLNIASAREAIQRPAEVAGIPFTAEGLEKLVAELTGATPSSLRAGTVSDVEPLHLQVACTRLWSSLPPGTTVIGPDHVDRAGGVDESLREYYSEVVRRVSEETKVEEQKIRLWFDKALLHGSVRAQVAEGSEADHGLTPGVVDALVDAYLVRREQRRSTTWFEMAHDRLVSPVRDANQQWFQAHPLYRRAREWDESGRRKLLLLWPHSYRNLEQKSLGTDVEKQFLGAIWRFQLGVGAVALGLILLGVTWLRYTQDIKASYWRGAWERLDLQHEIMSRTYSETVPEIIPYEEMPAGDIPAPTNRPAPAEPSKKDSIFDSEKSAAEQLLPSRSTTPAMRAAVRIEVENGRVPKPARDFILSQGYQVSDNPASPDSVPNSISFDTSVPIEVVRELAYAMRAHGHPIHRIRTIRSDSESDLPANAGDRRPLIKLSYVDILREWPPLTVEQIERLSPRLEESP